MLGRNFNYKLVAGHIATVAALHAAAGDKRVSSMVLNHGLTSWMSLVNAEMHRHRLDNTVPGALTAYDLPRLAAAFTPRKLTVIDPEDSMGHPMDLEQAEKELADAVNTYDKFGVEGGLKVIRRLPTISIARTIDE